MGLFDFLNQDASGYGGLFGGQFLPSFAQSNSPKIEYDALGNPIPNYSAPDSPFPSVAPPVAQIPQMQAQSPVFGFSGAPSNPWGVTLPQPQSAPPQMAQPAPPVAPPQIAPQATDPNMVVGSMGNLPVPTFGQGDPAQIPASARPAQYQSPAVEQTSSSPGFGDRLTAGLMNFANAGGPLQALAGGVSGLVSGQRSDSTGLLQQQQSATFKSLVGAGMPPNLAMAAALNPDLMKQVAPQYFAKPQLQETGTDPLTGKKTFAQYDSTEGTLKPLQAPGGTTGGDSGGSMDALQKAQAAGVTGEALYQYLPAGMSGAVKAMIEGRQPMPSTQAMRSPAILAMIDAAHTIDPTFDATTWAQRVAGQKDFYGGGKSAEMTRAANQTLHHVGQLIDSMDNLNNGRFPVVNAAGNFVNEQTGGGAPGAFRTNAHAVAEEMSKVFKGANLSDAEIRAWESNLNENMSPEQQRAQVGKLRDLLQGSLHALEEKRVSSIGPMAAAKAGPLIQEEGQRVLQKLDDWIAKRPGASAAPSSTLPSGWSVKVR